MKWLIAIKIVLKIPCVMWKAWREYNSLYQDAWRIAWLVARQCGVTEREMAALLRQLRREEIRERWERRKG